MDFNEFQQKAANTDQRKTKEGQDLMIPLLGLFGEIGSVAAEFKKRIRDGQGYKDYESKLIEELGDVLWYISTLCTDMGVDLNNVAETNIRKTIERWENIDKHDRTEPYDAAFPDGEQFPRMFEIVFKENENDKMQMYLDGKEFGDPLTDNAYEDDGYRFHDAFHLSFVGVLGWSPVIRSLMKRKRKSNNEIDTIEDGARAIIIEEAISAIIYEYVARHDFLKGITTVDYELLSTIKKLVAHLEVSDASSSLWEDCIIQGCQAFVGLRTHGGGILHCDLDSRKITFKNG